MPSRLTDFRKQSALLGHRGKWEAAQEKMWQIFVEMFPQWKDHTEEILYEPSCGVKYCEAVRDRVCSGYTDNFTLKSFVNIRKSGLLRVLRGY